jgi:putative heme iron utilization protein
MTRMTGESAQGFQAANAAKRLLREARTAALATLDADGAPYASLVQVASLPDATPVLLLSNLARHTRNLATDSRASLLLEERREGSELEGARISLKGRVVREEGEAARRRYLLRHPDAAGFAGFSDFAFYRLELESAHLVAGFGRIVDLAREDMIADLAGTEALLAAEAGAVEHMNADHADAVALYAANLLGAPTGDWRIIGLDPEGCDLMLGARVRRLDFPRRISAPGELRAVLVELAHLARGA